MSAMLFVLDKIDKSEAIPRMRRNFYSSQATVESFNREIEQMAQEIR